MPRTGPPPGRSGAWPGAPGRTPGRSGPPSSSGSRSRSAWAGRCGCWSWATRWRPRLGPSRAGLLVVAVGLAALGTASAGPVGFVALVAPQIVRRLLGGRGAGLLSSAGVGALVVVAADLVARTAFSPHELPVGVLTALVGAPVLVYLLVRARRVGAGG